jgi:hypothetical protein
VNQEWERQSRKASKTIREFVIKTRRGITPFTTITVNKSWPTAAHIDSGDLKEGFGVMCCLGEFDGCDLVFPRYKTAVRYREGDILLADVANQVHGNTPLLKPDGSAAEDDGLCLCLRPLASIHVASQWVMSCEVVLPVQSSVQRFCHAREFGLRPGR